MHESTCPGWYQPLPPGICTCKVPREPELKMNDNRNGSPEFYKLTKQMEELHHRKSGDYAANDNPYGNYHFAGTLAALFKHSPKDMGFIGRIGEKIYRLANLESSGKNPTNEPIEDTELDICVITLLWMSDRRERRLGNTNENNRGIEDRSGPEQSCGRLSLDQ